MHPQLEQKLSHSLEEQSELRERLRVAHIERKNKIDENEALLTRFYAEKERRRRAERAVRGPGSTHSCFGVDQSVSTLSPGTETEASGCCQPQLLLFSWDGRLETGGDPHCDASDQWRQ